MGRKIQNAYGVGGPIISVFPVPITNAGRAPNSSDTEYPQGQQWFVGQGSGAIEYVYQGSGVWATGVPGSVSAITGDTGSASPSGGAIKISGGTTGFTFTGAGSTVTMGGSLNVAGGGTGASTLTGILIGNGAAPVTGNPVTQFAVLVGGASNAVTSIADVAVGQALMSGGVAANPAFTGSPSFSGSVTAATTITATSGAITATSGNFVSSAAGNGIVLNSGTASGTTAATLNGRSGQITITTPSIGAGAQFTFTITNSSVTASTTQILYGLTGGTNGSAITIQSVTNSAGQSVVVLNNATAVTANTGSLVLTFLVLN